MGSESNWERDLNWVMIQIQTVSQTLWSESNCEIWIKLWDENRIVSPTVSFSCSLVLRWWRTGWAKAALGCRYLHFLLVWPSCLFQLQEFAFAFYSGTGSNTTVHFRGKKRSRAIRWNNPIRIHDTKK